MAATTDDDFTAVAQGRTTILVKEALAALIAGLLAFLGFWRISGVSWSDIGGLWGRSDAIVEYSMAKTQSSSILGFFDPNLGYPHGQDWTHFPVLDPANRIELSLLTTFLDPVTAVNVLLVASFPLIAILMYAALRNLHVLRSLAVVGGVSLALVGYHFDYEHPFLGNYWAVPVGIVWLSVLANADSVLAQRYRKRTVAGVGLLAAVAVGLHNPQYTVFLSIVGVVAVLIARNRNAGSLHVFLRAVILATPALTLLAWLAIGRLSQTVPAVTSSTDRPLIDSYVWAGKFVSLLTVPGDSILSGLPFNQDLLTAQEIADVTGVSTLQSAPVVAATILVLVLVVTFIVRSQRPDGADHVFTDSSRPWVAMWLVAASLFVTGAMGLVFSALVYPQVRGWARIAVVLAALALTAALIFVSGIFRQRKSHTCTKQKVGFVALAGLVTVVFLDQFTATYPMVQDSKTLPALRGLLDWTEEQPGTGCPILSIPVMAFPEALPPGRTLAYDQLLPYLAGVPGPFSYGAVRGQLGSRWTDHLAVQPADLAQQAAAEGFCAILVDVDGLTTDSPSLEQYERVLGPAASSALDRWFLFSLPGTERAEPKNSLFSKPEVNYGSAFTPEKFNAEGEMTRWTRSPEASLKVWNPGLQEMEWIARTTLEAADCPNDQTVELRTSSGFKEAMSLDPGEQRDVFIPLRIPSKGHVTVNVLTGSEGCAQEEEASPVGVRISDLRFSTNQQSGADIAKSTGFHPVETSDSGDVWQWMNGDSSAIQVISTSNDASTVTVSGQIQAPLCKPADVVTVTVGGNAVQTLTVTPGAVANFVLPLSLDPFASATIGFTASSPGCFVDGDERLLGPKVQNLRVSSSPSTT